MLEQKPTILVIPHSHIDIEWYWTAATSLQWMADILHRVQNLLKRDPYYCFTQDQVFLIKNYWEGLQTSERAFFRQAVSEGRLELVGGMYVQPEVAEPCGECLVRQVLAGQGWLQENLGVRSRCAWLIDTFGQIPQLPQILIRSGFASVVFFRDIPLQVPFDDMPADFFWQSPDGTRIRAHWMPGGYSDNPTQAALLMKHTHTRHVFYPHGKDIDRPFQDSFAIRQEVSRQLADLGFQIQDIQIATPTRFFKEVNAERVDFPVLDWDFNPPFYGQDLRGTYDNRIELKKSNRQAEQALLNAERLASLGYISGHAYPKQLLAGLWEKLLFTQNHDTIGGSSSDPVYTAAMQRLEEVTRVSEQLARQSLALMLPGQPGEFNQLVVFNTQSFTRSELCRVALTENAGEQPGIADSSGKKIPFRRIHDADDVYLEFAAENIPPVGFRIYQIVAGAPSEPEIKLDLSQNWIENGFFRLEWNPLTGDLTRIWDRRNHRDVLSGPGNVIIARQENNPEMEGSLSFSGKETRSSQFQARQVEIRKDAISVRMKATSFFEDCFLVRETILYDFAARIDFVTTFGNFQGGDVLINTSFPLALEWAAINRTYETPFAATPRPEGHFAAQTWVDCSDPFHGATLFNYGTPGYWVQNGCLELTLLRSFANYAGYQKYGQLLGVPGYENSTQTELAREHGDHTFRYTLFPHEGSWHSLRLFEIGQSLNSPLVTMPVHVSGKQPDTECFLSAEPGFLLSAIKVAEDGIGLIVRGFETTGKAHQVIMIIPSTVGWVRKTSLMEDWPEIIQVSEGKLLFFVNPFEIVTLWLDFSSQEGLKI